MGSPVSSSGNLIVDIGVVNMGRLPGTRLLSLIGGIKGALRGDRGPACGKVALIGDRERCLCGQGQRAVL